MNYKQIIQGTFFQLAIIFSIAILLASIGLFSKYSLHFEIASIIIATLGIFFLNSKTEEEMNKKTKMFLFVLAILLIIIIRMIYYFNYDIPLGYDAGLYKYGFEKGLENKDEWILRGGMEPGFLYIMTPLNYIFGSHFLMIYGYIICTIILGIAIYFCTKSFFGEKSAIFSLLIYALSTTQYIVFTFMYYKNVIALSLMLFALSIINKENIKYKIIFVLLFALVGTIHRPTFYIFGISLFLYSFIIPISKDKYDFKKLSANLLIFSIGLILAIIPYIGSFWQAISSMFYPVLKSISNPGESPGTFISFFSYQFVSLPYLLFALLGIFACIKMRKTNFILVWVIMNIIIVYFQLFFFNRFIIHLDITMIIFAGFGMSILANTKKKTAYLIIAILILSSAIFTINEAIKTRPIITQENLDAIKKIPEITEENSFIMSITKEYSPWLIAYSERKTIAPGLFDYDLWTQEEWNVFWNSQSRQETINLMQVYKPENQKIYVFVGTKGFSNPCFSEINDKIQKYDC